jgi:hypothetical protein
MIKDRIDELLAKYAKADHPDIDDNERDKLMETHFYYLHEDIGRGGFYVPKSLSTKNEDEKEIHQLMKDTGWN